MATKTVTLTIEEDQGTEYFHIDTQDDITVAELVGLASMMLQILARDSGLGLEGSMQEILKAAIKWPIKK